MSYIRDPYTGELVHYKDWKAPSLIQPSLDAAIVIVSSIAIAALGGLLFLGVL